MLSYILCSFSFAHVHGTEQAPHSTVSTTKDHPVSHVITSRHLTNIRIVLVLVAKIVMVLCIMFVAGITRYCRRPLLSSVHTRYCHQHNINNEKFKSSQLEAEAGLNKNDLILTS